jgi:hypothetical protein
MVKYTNGFAHTSIAAFDRYLLRAHRSPSSFSRPLSLESIRQTIAIMYYLRRTFVSAALSHVSTVTKDKELREIS